MDNEAIIKEFKFKAVRSSGAGGQHVNKVATKIELSFDVVNSDVLDEKEKHRILNKLESRITKDGVLILQNQETRSLLSNKKLAIQLCIELITSALKVQKPRKKTKPSRASKEKRLKAKKISAAKKEYRKKPGKEDI